MGLKLERGLNKCYLWVRGTQGLVCVSHTFLGEVSFWRKTCRSHPGLQWVSLWVVASVGQASSGLAARWSMVFTALLTNLIPEALIGMLCFIFN